MKLRGMRKQHAQSLVLAAAAVGSSLVVAPSAHASNPLEYPDNGAAAFSRAGAWLATANEPIAAHYNPAGLATQGSGFSIDQNLNFDKVCFDRHGPNGAPEGPSDGYQYLPTCNSRAGFPTVIPSIAFTWRATKQLGIGIALVPPATYGTAQGEYPAFSPGLFAPTIGGVKRPAVAQPVPAPYRYMGLENKSTVIFPTLGIGYELFHNFRIGAGFISGIAVINATVGGIGSEPYTVTGDHVNDVSSDSTSTVHTKDLFVPGAVVALHWSLTRNIDVAAWGRWISDIRATHGDLTTYSQVYNSGTLSSLNPICRQGAGVCSPHQNVAIQNYFSGDAFRELRVTIPPEVRVGVRFHLPRSERGGPKGEKLAIGAGLDPSRDPLHDDLFDVEVDGSYTANSKANTTEVRFADNGKGMGLQSIVPTGKLPPNADQWNGYIDSYGIRVGGQVNVIQDKLGLRAGTWLETRSQDPAWLNIGVVGGMRGGFGGGVVVRQGFIDISLGYQHQWSDALDNGGYGAMRTTITSGATAQGPEPNLNNEPPGVTAANRTQYRSGHTVNDGRLTQSANAFTLGGTVHF